MTLKEDDPLARARIFGLVYTFPLWVVPWAIVRLLRWRREERATAIGVRRAFAGRIDDLQLGVVVDPANARRRMIEISAEVARPLGPPLQAIHGEIVAPSLGDVNGDAEPPGWTEICAHAPAVAIASDGRRVVAWLGEPCTTDDLGRVIETVRAIATEDTALARLLASLPDATPDPSLSPGVVLAPDGLRVGVDRGAMFAALGDVRFDFPAIERDRARIEAAIEKLRASPSNHDGPYR